MKRKMTRVLSMMLALAMLAGCGAAAADTGNAEENSVDISDVYQDEVLMEEVILEDEAVALAEAPAVPTFLKPEASGQKVKKNDKAMIDYSHVEDGYVMVKYVEKTSKRLKAQVKGPRATYTYNLVPGQWTVFPFSDGNGSYRIGIYRNTSGTKYSSMLSLTVDVKLTDEFAPFLRPNQYVNYTEGSATAAKAKELTAGISDPLKKVDKVYNYVVKNLTYDRNRASTVKSGYLPNLDAVLKAKKGICFDYAALMTGMLRSQGVPCKLVIGYAGKAYHAWISVWTEEKGWIEGAVYFNGSSWQRMDPTFASTGKQSDSAMKFIGDGKNYSAKYFY